MKEINNIKEPNCSESNDTVVIDISKTLEMATVCVEYIVIAVFYYVFCYMSLPALTKLQSCIIYALLVILAGVVEYISPYHTKPTDFIISELLLLETITCIKYYDYFEGKIIIGILLAILLSLITTIIFIIIKEKNNVQGPFSNELTAKFFKKSIAIILVPLVLSISFVRYNSDKYFKNIAMGFEDNSIQIREGENKYTYKELLADWETKTAFEKSAALTVLETDICTELGINAPSVYTGIIDEGTSAGYNPEKNSICIDYSWLKTADLMSSVDCIAHESYHAYQTKLINLYNNLSNEDKKLKMLSDNHIPEYVENSLNYISPDDKDYSEYLSQALEVDARAFAKDQMINILNNARIHL